jgi:hypothetical protein
MSKIVTIPTGGGNPFVVILGGVKYVYKPGETVEVPDGVALEIEEWERWHEKYYGENVPPFGAGGGGADWNQNDPNAPDYVKNRTHYGEVKYGTIVRKQVVYAFGKLKAVRGTPIEGKTYIVTLNEAQYECVAWWNDNGKSVMLGNGALAEAEGMGEDVPFAINFSSVERVFFYTNDSDDEDEYTITIEGESEAIHKIDEKYLPTATTFNLTKFATDNFGIGTNYSNIEKSIPYDEELWKTIEDIAKASAVFVESSSKMILCQSCYEDYNEISVSGTSCDFGTKIIVSQFRCWLTKDETATTITFKYEYEHANAEIS